MGLINRAKDDQFTKLQEESEAAAKDEAWETELDRQRVEIITQKLEIVAAKLEEPLESITQTPIGLPRYYVLGDIVIMVQRFMGSNEKPDPGTPQVLTFSYCTYLIGLNPDKKLMHRKIGTLKFLDYPGIAKAITEAPPDYVFDAEAVKLYLP